MYFCLKLLSASSWGCELKYECVVHVRRDYVVSLFVRLWVEMCHGFWLLSGSYRQPLREAVSWNINLLRSVLYGRAVSLFVRLWVEMSPVLAPMCALTVSLFVRLWVEIAREEAMQKLNDSQPLREAVSWNADNARNGFELVSQPLREAVSWNNSTYPIPIIVVVSLFVRLWVEMSMLNALARTSTCQPLREAVSWNMYK